ncbi:MAG: methyltransferase domain-containing protein [Gammaproteobacteria bacterium]|nr:methyltransferase domain-containing protein [Gammaproteobacteria bacterium]MCW8927320.1 methyltransferase domain-containing protein [Gammaproteobacteria bacterium]MCW8958077.1 methyltransferase domain-containing protein [Gammaproteobacteria bacterium]MCW8971685.1 methyltransferase domain-containing protein [Gammaproteobacteria bacterium]MCW8993410.1 methyltransferase domain-containing protein [Gammaproteobacteria bacterium]
MRKYHGTLIHKSRDEEGEIEVIDDAVYRSLHFGSEPKQSSMLLRDPFHLALAYTRAMACAVLFHEAPKDVLLIGLGGGSLAKFLLQHFPQCRIEAVETREAVVEVARSHFHLPEDPRIHFHIGDGGSFVRNHATQQDARYDLIFVDAFLGSGIARTVCGISFFDASRHLLSDGGIFSMNLWNGDFINAREMLEDIRESFNDNVLKLPVDGKDNTIALAGKGVMMKRQLKQQQHKARQMEQGINIEFSLFLKQLKKHNGWSPF